MSFKVTPNADGTVVLSNSSTGKDLITFDAQGRMTAPNGLGGADGLNPLQKPVPTECLLNYTGVDLELTTDALIGVNSILLKFAEGTTVTLPTLTGATDYKVYAESDKTLVAQPWDDAVPTDSTLVGGFHAYHTGATINPDSVWDVKWRAKNPRAMTLSPDGRNWVDKIGRASCRERV